VILSDRMILAAIKAGDIVIDPFDPKALGTNSYDVHLGDVLKTYKIQKERYHEIGALDCKVDNPTVRHEIGPEGFVLRPGTLYLGSTKEYTETRKHVPFLDGKSSIGRLGITIHCTAGRGDVGFCNHWTLEIHVIEPVRVYAGMPIGQLIYFETGEVDLDYATKASAKYRERCAEPVASYMYKNFESALDHKYLSAGDNPYASGDRAYRGCSLCGQPRSAHPQ
jgi:dCTP deaminase